MAKEHLRRMEAAKAAEIIGDVEDAAKHEGKARVEIGGERKRWKCQNESFS